MRFRTDDPAPLFMLKLRGSAPKINDRKGISNIGNIASSADNAEIKTKLAFIVSSDVAYGLVRMYEVLRSFSSNATKTVKVFRNENEAFDWVRK